MNKCQSCVYFQPDPQRPKLGNCHRYAPSHTTPLSDFYWWPVVRVTDGCGDYRGAAAPVKAGRGAKPE
jgi:hypothetical protein